MDSSRNVTDTLFCLFCAFLYSEKWDLQEWKTNTQRGKYSFYCVFLFSHLLGGHSPGIETNIEKVSEKNGAIVSVWENIKESLSRERWVQLRSRRERDYCSGRQNGRGLTVPCARLDQ